MTRALHIVLPMGGRGSRFKDKGYMTPKPLIEVDGMPMFLKALSSLTGIKANKRYTAIIRKEHQEEYGLEKLLRKVLPEINIVITDEEPIGSAVDALRSEPYLVSDEGVIIIDCDLWFRSNEYNRAVEQCLKNKGDIQGVLVTFKSEEPRYSFAKMDEAGMLVDIAEKKSISDRAITGAYFFSRADMLVDLSKKLFSIPLNEGMKEYYVSFLYQILLKDGKKVKVTKIDKYYSFGTPEELEIYEKNQIK